MSETDKIIAGLELVKPFNITLRFGSGMVAVDSKKEFEKDLLEEMKKIGWASIWPTTVYFLINDNQYK